MADKYEEFELKGREEFKTWADTNYQIWNLEFSENKYEHIDGYFWSGYSKMSFELKRRKHSSETIWYGTPLGFIMEKIKYDALMESDSDQKLFVIIFDDRTIIWDVTYMKPEWIVKKYACNHSRLTHRDKEVTYLTLENATHIINKTKI